MGWRKLKVTEEYLLIDPILVQDRTDVCQYGVFAGAASRWVAGVMYSESLTLLFDIARFDCERAYVSAVLLELPLIVVKPIVDEEADPGESCLLFCWAAEMEDVFRWMVCSRHERIPPGFPDGQNVALADPGVAQQSRHHYVPRFMHVVL
jgi:hypothetical protein